MHKTTILAIIITFLSLGASFAGVTYYQKEIKADEDCNYAPFSGSWAWQKYGAEILKEASGQCTFPDGSTCYYKHIPNNVPGESSYKLEKIICYPPPTYRIITISDCEKVIQEAKENEPLRTKDWKLWCEQVDMVQYPDGETYPIYAIKAQLNPPDNANSVELAISEWGRMGGYIAESTNPLPYPYNSNNSSGPLNEDQASQSNNQSSSSNSQQSLSTGAQTATSSPVPPPSSKASQSSNSSTLKPSAQASILPSTQVAQSIPLALPSIAAKPSSKPILNSQIHTTYNPISDLTPWQRFTRWLRKIFK